MLPKLERVLDYNKVFEFESYRLPKIKEYVDQVDPKAVIIPFSGAVEAQIVALGPEEAEAYCKEKAITR